MRIAFFSIIILPVFILLMLLPILLGIYVYRDARRRGMNTVLWTLIVVLAPALLGFIIYLLVRSSYSVLACPKCNASVSEQYITCPHCGAKLKPSCAQCDFPVEPDWAVCPKCSAPIEMDAFQNSTPVRKDDVPLTKILLVIIAIPFILLMVLIIGSIVITSASYKSGSMTTAHVSPETYQDNAEISTWLAECNQNPDKTYVLCYLVQRNEEKVSTYLIYRPAAVNATDLSATPDRGLFHDSLELYFTEGDEPAATTADDPGYQLTFVSYYSDEFLDTLNIYVNDEEIEYELADVDYNPALFELISE